MVRLQGLPPQGPFYSISDTPEGIQWLAMEGTTEDGDAILVGYGPDSRRFDIHDQTAVHREVDRLSANPNPNPNPDWRWSGFVLVLWWLRPLAGTG